MSSEPTPLPDSGRPVYSSRPWFRVSAVWAGLSFVLVATVVVARRGFTELAEEQDRTPSSPRSPRRLGMRPGAPRVET